MRKEEQFPFYIEHQDEPVPTVYWECCFEKNPACTRRSQERIRWLEKRPGTTPYCRQPPTPSATPITSAFPRILPWVAFSRSGSGVPSLSPEPHSSTCLATK